MGKKPTFNDVLKHSKELQAEHNREDNFRSTVQKLQNVLIQDAEKRLFNANIDEKKAIFDSLDDTQLFIQYIEGFLSRGEDIAVPTDTLLKQIKNKLLDSYGSAKGSLLDVEMTGVIDKALKLIATEELAATTRSKPAESKEVEKQVDQMREKKTRKEPEKMTLQDVHSNARDEGNLGNINKFNWSKINSWEELLQNPNKVEINTLQKSLDKMVYNQDKKSIFGDNLYISPTLDKPFTQGQNASPFSAFGETPYYVLGTWDASGKLVYMLLSLSDFRQLEKKPLPNSFLFSAQTGKPRYVGKDVDFKKVSEEEQFGEVLAQTRFVAGDVNQLLRKKNFGFFKKWVNSKGAKECCNALPYVLTSKGESEYWAPKKSSTSSNRRIESRPS